MSMSATTDLKPGTVVRGPFTIINAYDREYAQGVGIVQKRGKRYPYNVGPDHVPVRIVVGDRVSGGYRPESLTPITDLKVA